MSPIDRVSGIVVDTSVFIDFFRSGSKSSALLSSLLDAQRVILSPYVRLELQMGVKKSERKSLGNLLEALPLAILNQSHFALAESLISLVRVAGLNVGLVDYLVTLQALDLQVPIYTLDQEMKKLAKTLEVGII